MPVGSGNAAVTPAAACGPLLLTVTVYVNVSPGLGRATLGTAVTARSVDGTVKQSTAS